MNPNQYLPAAGPAPANVVLDPPTTVELAPNTYRPLTEEEGIAHIGSLDSHVAALQENIRQYNNHQANTAANRYNDPQEQQDEDDRIRNERLAIEDGIANLYATSDSTAILNRLGEHFGTEQGYQAGIGTVNQGFVTRADNTRLGAQRARTDFTTTVLNHNNNPVPGLAPGHSQQDALDHRRAIESRAAAHSGGSYNAALTGLAASRAAIARDKRFTGERQRAGFDTAVENIYVGLLSNHNTAVYRMDGEVANAVGLLRNWDLQQTPAPGQEDQVRAALDLLSTHLNDHNILGAHDSERARIFGEWTRLRYRVEARSINFTDPYDTRPRPVFTADGGIVINANGTAAQRAVIYENGDVMRAGGVRRDPGGHPSEAPAPLVLDETHVAPNLPLDHLVARWEENRTPETALDAHAAISEVIGTWQEQDDQLVATAEQLEAQRVAALGEVTRLQGITGRTPEQDLELQTAQNDLRTVLPRIQRTQNDLRQVRAQLNPAQYTRNLIEVGAERPEPANQPTGLRRMRSRIMGQSVQSTEQSAPELQPDGSLVINNMVMNGNRGTWRIYADGRAGHVVQSQNMGIVTEYHHPNGDHI